MTTTMTWTNFGIAALVLLISHYLLIGIYFYYGQWKTLVDSRQRAAFIPFLREEEEPPVAIRTPPVAAPAALEPQVEVARVELLIGHIKSYFAVAADEGFTKQELIGGLQELTAAFPDIGASPYVPALNELILQECKEFGLMALSEDDAVQLWIQQGP